MTAVVDDDLGPNRTIIAINIQKINQAIGTAEGARSTPPTFANPTYSEGVANARRAMLRARKSSGLPTCGDPSVSPNTKLTSITASASVREPTTPTQTITPFGESDPCTRTRPADSQLNSDG